VRRTVVIRASRIHQITAHTALEFAGARIMTMTCVWIGVALWLGLNVAFVARRIYVTRPVKIAANSRRTHVRLV
jgi:hypothetical protein